MPDAQSAYIPGVCNINDAEVAKRRKFGHICLAVFIILLVTLLLTGVSRYYRIVLFLPAFFGANCYLQVRNKFCVGYAGAGKQNATQGSKEAVAVSDKAARAADKKRARRMNMQAFDIAVILTVIAFLIPLT